jgi:hypothetical protein
MHGALFAGRRRRAAARARDLSRPDLLARAAAGRPRRGGRSRAARARLGRRAAAELGHRAPPHGGENRQDPLRSPHGHHHPPPGPRAPRRHVAVGPGRRGARARLAPDLRRPRDLRTRAGAHLPKGVVLPGPRERARRAGRLPHAPARGGVRRAHQGRRRRDPRVPELLPAPRHAHLPRRPRQRLVHALRLPRVVVQPPRRARVGVRRGALRPRAPAQGGARA